MGGKARYILGLDAVKTPSSSPPCPHSDGKGVPPCWDCIEEGQLRSPSLVRRGSVSSAWHKIGRFRNSLAFMDSNFNKITLPSTGAQGSEVQLPEDGLEVVHGPEVVSLEEKLQKLRPKGSNSNMIREEDVVSNPESNPESGALPEPIQTVWGIRKRTFWILVVIVILVLLGVVIGIAVGVTQQKSIHSTSLEMSGSGQPINTAPPARTTTAPISPSSTSSPSSRICIGDDGSTYTDPGTGDKFKIECDVSHNGQDIENVEAQTMQDCISLCAKSNYCKGASWYNVGPQGTDLNYCWLKSGMGSDVRITPDAQSVIRL
ncbi:hypothetical protein GGR51DRAFT_189538 [Nemania sp. FL0031]|nr:hypothetical protein GGR51DRAFT_189538 [Nemania sp. FL0031]